MAGAAHGPGRGGLPGGGKLAVGGGLPMGMRAMAAHTARRKGVPAGARGRSNSVRLPSKYSPQLPARAAEQRGFGHAAACGQRGAAKLHPGEGAVFPRSA